MTGRKADVIKAAWHAAELAMRTVKVGNKNWAVTDAVSKVTAEWGCKAVEGEFEFYHYYFYFSFFFLCARVYACTD